MNYSRIIVLLVVFPVLSFAQIDTTEWYPLQIGNVWQFSYQDFFDITESSYITFEVIGDTIINKKKYFILSSWNGHYYQRVVNNKFVYEYSPHSDQEYLRYDFVSPDRSIWDLDSISGQYGIYKSLTRYIRIYGDSLESKVYISAYIDTNSSVNDTTWDTWVDGSAITITKGLGITEYGQGINNGTFVGAVINGDSLGTVTSVAANEKFEKEFHLLQNYPNPFNPITKIQFSIPQSSDVSLKIYDTMGREIKTLLKENKSPGNYEIEFNGSGLSSGVYFYRITTENYSDTKKMILMK